MMSRSTALAFALSLFAMKASEAAPGDWPRPRQNAALTGSQPLPGRMAQAPALKARWDLGRTRPAYTLADPDLALALHGGALYCYDLKGQLQWQVHPPGLNFTQITTLADLDGDGRQEVVLQAGRPTPPYGAAAIVGLEKGELLWQCEVEPMSYAWYLYADHFLPGEAGKQLLVVMHGYPPDQQNGYLALYACPGPGQLPQELWRYDFHEYTCFPSLLQSDLDGDGVREICIQTHSRMWILDPHTGAVQQFLGWDVSPGNVRSYGLVRFVDLDGDGREDFLCIANFSQHHEVLLNRGGELELAWAKGWPESVTTGKVATTWAEPPQADLDGDGRLEIALSMYNSEDEGAWLLRGYDALSGELRFRLPGAIAVATGDLDGDGQAEILANLSADPTRSAVEAAALLKVIGGRLQIIWQQEEAIAAPGPGFAVRLGESSHILSWEEGQVRLTPAPPPPPGPDLSHLPALAGPPPPQLLVADLDRDGRHEILCYREGQAQVLSLQPDHTWKQGNSYISSGLPALADLDGDGHLEIVTGQVSPAHPPRLEARTPALGDRLLWSAELPPSPRTGLPYGHPLYIQPGRFTGAAAADLYVWAGIPLVRSLVVEGRSGRVVWEKGEIEGSERYWGPSVNVAAGWDVDGDGAEDLVFTNPDYYCILAGPSGQVLHGPSFPPKIFAQPSQGLYSFPALLAREEGPPLVCLAGAHYFLAVMGLDAAPRWYRIPVPGENRAGSEGFLRSREGRWLIGVGRQNGNFACVEAESGAVRWELPVGATCTDIISGDLDGDGELEFLFGTSHGQLWAVGDAGNQPRLLWKMDLPAGSGPPLVADVDGDGACEILVYTLDGHLNVLGP
jgi:hypothetical protein